MCRRTAAAASCARFSSPRRVPGQRGRGADSQRQYRVSTGTHPSLVPARVIVARFRMATILYVDDEPTIGLLLEETLERVGHRAIGASNVPQALQALSHGDIELIISD